MKHNRLFQILLAIASSVIISFLVFAHASASVDDFSFSNFEADYYLSKDSDGRSIMKVVEHLTAEFPNFDQNKGIIRAIPIYYDGHSLSFELSSLTRNGQNEPIYSQYTENRNTVIETGTDDYVQGAQEYVFTYTLRDTVKTFGNNMELYWDTNGTGWTQKFDKLTARVHLDESVSDYFTGDISCYQGPAGSNEKCLGVKNGDEIIFSSTRSLAGGENLTFDIEFKAGAFTAYQMTVWDYAPYGLLVGTLLMFGAALRIKFKYGRDFQGRGTIMAEYMPPKNVSVLTASEISGTTLKSSTAQMIDLAVRHKIRIIESKEKVLFGEETKYTLELLDFEGLDEKELKFIDILFSSREIGNKYTFDKNDRTKGEQLSKLMISLVKNSITEGYRLKLTKQNIWMSMLATFTIILSFGASFWMMANGNTDGFAIGIIASAFLTIAVIGFGLFGAKPLTQKGRELFDYLKGLKLYIKMAEIDRINFLQTPNGAEKKSINTDDAAQMIVLYEKTLPYAILFGQEKKWIKELGNFYENSQAQPIWYSGTNGFNAAIFASSFNGFSSYASSSSFSSSSGAGGGGMSGGGGGGGGGGGR